MIELGPALVVLVGVVILMVYRGERRVPVYVFAIVVLAVVVVINHVIRAVLY